MHRIIRLAAIIAVTAPLSGCFFVFIPGSLIRAASDAITGDKGQHCVNRLARAGDKVTMPGGGVATVVSISGPSISCQNPAIPIRAELAF